MTHDHFDKRSLRKMNLRKNHSNKRSLRKWIIAVDFENRDFGKGHFKKWLVSEVTSKNQSLRDPLFRQKGTSKNDSLQKIARFENNSLQDMNQLDIDHFKNRLCRKKVTSKNDAFRRMAHFEKMTSKRNLFRIDHFENKSQWKRDHFENWALRTSAQF